jgi:hypothetical protein
MPLCALAKATRAHIHSRALQQKKALAKRTVNRARKHNRNLSIHFLHSINVFSASYRVLSVMYRFYRRVTACEYRYFPTSSQETLAKQFCYPI